MQACIYMDVICVSGSWSAHGVDRAAQLAAASVEVKCNEPGPVLGRPAVALVQRHQAVAARRVLQGGRPPLAAPASRRSFSTGCTGTLLIAAASELTHY